MKQNTNRLIVISLGTIIVIMGWLVISASKNESRSSVGVPGSTDKSSHTPPPTTTMNRSDAGLNPRRESGDLARKSADKTYYVTVGPANRPLELDESVVMARVTAGLMCLQKGTLPAEEKRIDNIKEAYKHLMRNSPIMAGYEPLWGIDHDRYFVFSGARETAPELAFKNGHAVEKTTGRMFRWWPPE